MGEELALTASSKKKSIFEKRIHEIDFIRGLLICIVLFDHILNTFMLNANVWFQITGNPIWNGLFNSLVWYWNCVPRFVIREICLYSFCFISGISCAFSRNNWRRAGEMILVFGLIQVGSNLLQSWGVVGTGSSVIIDFNVIGVLAFSTLFYCFVQNCSWRGLTASMLLWLLFATYGMDILRTIPGSTSARVPALFEPLFNVGDWMPLVPYIVFFFLGAIFSYFQYEDRKSKFKRHEWERPICFVGRHTIWIYLSHEIILIGLFALITQFIRMAYGA